MKKDKTVNINKMKHKGKQVKGRQYSTLTPFILIGVFALSLIAGCSNSDEVEKMSHPDDSIVKIEINGHLFDIPLSYMYGETVEKWGKWPKSKNDRVKVDNLSLSMLLPDLRPYSSEEDARWKVLGHGERIEVLIMKPVGSVKWFESVIKITNDDVIRGRSHKEGEKYGLTHFSEKIIDTYITTDSRALVIHCDRSNDVLSPSCKVKSNYREGVVFEYYYGLNFLAHWREIDDKLKALFDRFVQTTNSISIK
jgi:hypothetical protein